MQSKPLKPGGAINTLRRDFFSSTEMIWHGSKFTFGPQLRFSHNQERQAQELTDQTSSQLVARLLKEAKIIIVFSQRLTPGTFGILKIKSCMVGLVLCELNLYFWQSVLVNAIRDVRYQGYRWWFWRGQKWSHEIICIHHVSISHNNTTVIVFSW